MRNNDRKINYLINFQDNQGKNRERLRDRILSDPDWVQAFLQAFQDIRTENNPILHNSATR